MTSHYHDTQRYAALWEMQQKGEFTETVEAHYRTMLYDLDLVTYDNCVVDIDRLTFRKAMGTMAMLMPSLAMIDKYRTREISYNLHLTARDIDHPNLDSVADAFDSVNLRDAHLAIAAGLYHLVSGRELFDEKIKLATERLIRRCEQNRASRQNLYAVDTVSGRFDMYTNLLTMFAFKLSDTITGTDYQRAVEPMLQTLESKLKDPQTGLFYEYYQTGSFGFPMEDLNEDAFWTVKNIKAGANALSISLYHLFKPKEAETMWKSFKEKFSEELFSRQINRERAQSGFSYITELGTDTEDLFASLLCAKEMQDKAFFESLLRHIEEMVKPTRIEAKIFYKGFGEGQQALGQTGPICTYFGLFSMVHMGWKEILEFDWAKQYNMDFNKVR